MGHSHSNMTGVLIRSYQDTDTQKGEAHVKTQGGEDGCLQTKERGSEKSNLPTP